MTRETENNMMAEIAENERWLAQFEAPPPRDGLLDEIKLATRAALARDDQTLTMPVWWQRPWHGAVAAAAMVAICVGVVRYAPTIENQGIGSNHVDKQVTKIAFLPLIDWKSLPSTTSFDDEPLDELEEWEFGDSWALSGASMYEAFEAALVDDGSTGAESIQQGAIAPAMTGETRSI